MKEIQRVLIIGGKRVSFIKKAKELGLEVIFIQKKEAFDKSFLDYVDYCFILDYENIQMLLPIVEGIYKSLPFGYAVTHYEHALVPTAYVNDMLKLSKNSLECVLMLKDKWAMRKRLNSMNVSPVKASIGKTKGDIIRFVEDAGFPIILKPIDKSGSISILRIDKVNEIDVALGQLSSLEIKEFLMEEYLDGEEYTVEAFSFNGKHMIFSITDKTLADNFVELGHSTPSLVDNVTASKIKEVVVQFLDVIDLKEGATHTEVRVTSKGPRIIESHNRRGGGSINELVSISYGVDLEYLSLAWPFGLVDPIEIAPEPKRGSAVLFFTPEPGVVKEIIGLNEAKQKEGIVECDLKLKGGTVVKKIMSSYDRVGQIIAKGRDAREALELCEKTMGEIKIIVHDELSTS